MKNHKKLEKLTRKFKKWNSSTKRKDLKKLTSTKKHCSNCTRSQIDWKAFSRGKVTNFKGKEINSESKTININKHSSRSSKSMKLASKWDINQLKRMENYLMPIEGWRSKRVRKNYKCLWICSKLIEVLILT